MKRLEDYPIDPDVAAELDAIDATLAGEPVDPQHAELAELALLLAAGRPELEPEFARSLDARVQARFAAQDAGEAHRRRSFPHAPGWSASWLTSLGAGAAALVAAVAVVVVLSSGSGGSGSGLSTGAPTPSFSSSSTSAAATAAAGAAKAPASTGAPALVPAPAGAHALGSGEAASSAAPAPAGASTGTLQPPANGRKITQSAQLALTAAPTKIDAVAQEVFNVIGRENGVVNRSEVTATGGLDGYAEFRLSVPSSVLPQTMAALSRLPYAGVASRTDTSQDVNNQFVNDTRNLADARALRTALLKQLANAVTQQQIDSLNAQIHDAEASISSDQATLAGLNHQINFSQITLTINPRATPVPVAHGTGSFTLGKAAHDAGRVLTVGAGVALIALAVLVPVALIAALVWWVGVAVRRRRREQALDLA